jgi:sulfate adenylyltransferase
VDVPEQTDVALIEPYGGQLIDLFAPAADAAATARRVAGLPRLPLSIRTQHDLELLATGAFSPLQTFMGEADYRAVCEQMRLADGRVFPLPVTLPVPDGAPVRLGQQLALCDLQDEPLAILDVDEIFARDWAEEAGHIYGAADIAHPVIAEMPTWGSRLVSGRLTAIRLPRHSRDHDLRLTPAQTRARLARLNRSAVVAFNTRNPLHRVHEELTKRAMRSANASLLLHPVVGLTRPGDVDQVTRIRIYRRLVERYYDPGSTLLAVLPLAMRMAGPREAVFHAIIRRNFGASHFIVGRDHAGPGRNSEGEPFFSPFASRELANRLAPEIGVEILGFPEFVYVPGTDSYAPENEVPPGTPTISVSGSRVRMEFLAQGKLLPPWLTRPEAASELAKLGAAGQTASS